VDFEWRAAPTVSVLGLISKWLLAAGHGLEDASAAASAAVKATSAASASIATAGFAF